MAHVKTYSQEDEDGIFLYDKNKRRIGGPYPSNKVADEASEAVSAELGERPVEDYMKFLQETNPGILGGQSPIPERSLLPMAPNVAPGLFDDEFPREVKEPQKDPSLRDRFKKYLQSKVDNPYKDPFKRRVFEDILSDEGYIMFAYPDTKWNLTTGIGHKGYDPEDREGLLGLVDRLISTPKEASDLAKRDIDEKIETVKRIMGDRWNYLSDEVKMALINMAFRGDFKETHRFVALIKQGKMQEAAEEFLDNDDYRLSKRVGTGIWKRFEKNARRLLQ